VEKVHGPYETQLEQYNVNRANVVRNSVLFVTIIVLYSLVLMQIKKIAQDYCFIIQHINDI